MHSSEAKLTKKTKIVGGSFIIFLFGFVGFVNDIGGIQSWFFSKNNSTPTQIVKDTSKSQPQQVTGSSVGQSVSITGDNNSVSLDSETGKVEGASTYDPTTFLFQSDLNDKNKWTQGKGVKLRKNILSYTGHGTPGFFLSLSSFSQDNTYVVTFISHTVAPDLIIRLKDLLDARVGDGGPTEAAVHRFSPDGNWPEVPLDNPMLERDTRWKFPCSLPVGKEIKITLQISAFGEHRKTVTMYYEYQCQDGRYITQQDEMNKPAVWTFTVPERPNSPTQLGIGLNDPSGQHKPKVEILSVNVEHL